MLFLVRPMAKNISRTRKKPPNPDAKNYKHPESSSVLRPEVGVQPQFKKSKPPKTYRYDSALDHLASAVSAPFEAGEHKQVAVKVIDDGGKLLVVRNLAEAVE